MHAPEQPTSPHGLPAIRTDWLADVAWRLAAQGLEALRAPAFTDARLTDVVDGQPWRLEATRLSDEWETAVELDADLYLPSDRASATMRAGFDLTPAWDAAHGAVTRVRVEIGPRGAVTFDPENWMLTIPAQGAKPAVAGVDAGSWEPRGEDRGEREPGTAADLSGLELELLEVPESATEQRPVCELRLPGAPPARSKSLLAKLAGGGRRQRSQPVACLVVHAESAITAAAEGDDPAALDRVDRLTAVSGVQADQDHVAISGAEGTLVLRGTRIRAELQRLRGCARG